MMMTSIDETRQLLKFGNCCLQSIIITAVITPTYCLLNMQSSV